MANDDVDLVARECVAGIDQKSIAFDRILLGVARALAEMVEKAEPHTAAHQVETARFAVRMAKRLRFSKVAIRLVRLGAMLHDLGKIGVPASILLRPGTLSPNEFALVKEHPQIGWEILQKVRFPQIASPPMPIGTVVLQHHERLDGSGYPFGLKNGSIMDEAMLVGVADAAQAMLSHRAYRPRIGTDRIIGILEGDRGLRFPARYVDAAIDLLLADATDRIA